MKLNFNHIANNAIGTTIGTIIGATIVTGITAIIVGKKISPIVKTIKKTFGIQENNDSEE